MVFSDRITRFNAHFKNVYVMSKYILNQRMKKSSNKYLFYDPSLPSPKQPSADMLPSPLETGISGIY